MADGLNIRLLDSGNASEALLVARKFRERDGEVDEQRLQAFLDDPDTYALCAFDGAMPVGLVLAHRLRRLDGDPDELYVHAVDVLQSHRRTGIASKMLEFFKASLGDLECAEMWLITERNNEAAVALYQNAGGHTDDEDSVVFEWN